VAAAAALSPHGTITMPVAGTGSVLASLASALVNLPLIARVSGDRALTIRVALAVGVEILLGAKLDVRSDYFPGLTGVEPVAESTEMPDPVGRTESAMPRD
jgi:hypothetical protein